MKWLVIFASMMLWLPSSASAQSSGTFNSYILRAVDKIDEERRGGGYDIGAYFTRNLDYANEVIPSNRSPKTMCVAAVIEIIIEAMNIYAAEHGAAAHQAIPVTSWTKGNLNTLRANIFQYEGTGSRGTGHTLERFGLGKQLPFSDLKPGDFINFNRTNRTGHAVVFLGFLKANSDYTPYGDDVVGFRYFSAQGKDKPDAGFAYRDAFFDGHCPVSQGAVPRDCGLIRSSNSRLLNAGRMYSPETWTYAQALADIKAGVRSAFQAANPNATRGFLDAQTEAALNAELSPRQDAAAFFEGATTD